MNWIFTLLMWALLAAPVVSVRADDSNNKRASREAAEKRHDDGKKLSPDEREAKQKEWRKTNGAPAGAESEKRRDQWKNMTGEERAAKRKEIKGRLEKRISELRAKQANATLSAQEKRELERREQILKQFEPETPGAPRIERARPVFTNAPVKK